MQIFITLTWMWIAVGFLSGIKMLFIDRTLTNEMLNKMYDDAKTPSEQRVVVILSRKRNVLAICTLLGFAVLYFDILRTVRDIINGIKSFQSRNKSKK